MKGFRLGASAGLTFNLTGKKSGQKGNQDDSEGLSFDTVTVAGRTKSTRMPSLLREGKAKTGGLSLIHI